MLNTEQTLKMLLNLRLSAQHGHGDANPDDTDCDDK